METRSISSVRLVNLIIWAIGLFFIFLAIDAQGQTVRWDYPNAQYENIWVQQGGSIQINSPYTAVRVTVIESLSINDYGDMRGVVKYVKGKERIRVAPGRYVVVVDRKGKSMNGVWLGVSVLTPSGNHNPNY